MPAGVVQERVWGWDLQLNHGGRGGGIPSGMITADVGASSFAACHCPADFYADDRESVLNNDAFKVRCVACEAGLTCPAGSRWINFGIPLNAPAPEIKLPVVPAGPTTGASRQLSSHPVLVVLSANTTLPSLGVGFGIAEGFWMAELELPFRIKACHMLWERILTTDGYRSPCPGGVVNKCAEGREGVACGRCKPNYYRLSELDGSCAQCEGTDGWASVFTVLAFFAVTLGAYQFVNGPITAPMAPTTIICLSLGSLVSTMQNIAILSRMSLSWPDEVKSLWSFVNIFALDVRFLKAQCVFGNNTSVDYFGKLLVVLLCIGQLFGFAKFSRSVWPKNPRSAFWMDEKKTVNTFGTVYQGRGNRREHVVGGFRRYRECLKVVI